MKISQRGVATLMTICAAFGTSGFLPAAYAQYSDPEYLTRGREMLLDGNVEGALDQLTAIQTDGTRLDDNQRRAWLWLMAKSIYEEGEPNSMATAIRTLRDFLSEYPASAQSIEARALLGDCYFFSHDFPQALTEYSALDLKGLDSTASALYTYRKALSLIECGHGAEARLLLEEISRRSEYRQAATYYTAYLDYVDGHFDKALRGFESIAGAPSAGPKGTRRRTAYVSDGIEPGYYICQIYFDKGEWREAIEAGEKLMARRPVEALLPETRRAVGVSWFKLGDMHMAASYLEDYVAGRGDNAADDAVYALACALYSQGDSDQSAPLFSRLTDRNNDLAQSALLYLGQIAAAEGNASSAAMNFERAYRMSYNREVSAAALYDYVAARTRGGNIPFDSSVELLEQFSRSYPDSEFAPRVDTRLAEAYYNQGDYTKALQYIRRVKRPDAESRAVLARVLYACGCQAVGEKDWRRGAALLRECTDISGIDPALEAQARIWLGDALYHLDDYAGAERAYSAALRSGKAGAAAPIAEYDLAYALLMQKKYGEALKRFAKTADSKASLPGDIRTDARLREADCLYYTRRWSDASALYTSLQKEGVAPDYCAYRLAQLYGVGGDARRKIRTLEETIGKYPESPWQQAILRELGETYTAEGMSAKAGEAYGKIARLDGASETAAADYLTSAEQYEKSGDTAAALEAYEALEALGIQDYAPEAAAGIMRCADNPERQLEYARKVRAMGGLDAATVEEAAYIEGHRLLESRHEADRLSGEKTLRALAANPQTQAGAKAAVNLAEYLLRKGTPAALEEATDLLEDFTSSGSGQQYWMARGFIALSDAYARAGRRQLAREYLESLKQNYPGRELDIHNMIDRKLKALK